MKMLNSWELENKTLAKRGLKATLQDLISQIKEFPPELRTAINHDLTSNSLPSLNTLRGGIDKIINGVLHREKIKSFEEFYVVKEEVIDMDSNLPTEQRSLLDKYLAEFEVARNNNKASSNRLGRNTG